MNKHVILLSAAMALLFSCAKEPVVNEIQPGETITFTAGWADSEATRTALQSDGTSVWWTLGEEIMVYYGNKFSGKFTSTNTESQTLTSFSGSLSVLTGTVEEGNGSKSFIAVYPYDAAVACDGDNVTMVVPSVQTAVSDTFADKLFPAVAKSSNLDLAFYNVCGGVRFSVSQAGINWVTFKANDGKALAGKVKVGFGSDGYPVVKSVLDGKSEVKVTAPSGGYVPGKYYFAALLPGTMSKGLSMTFETSSHLATYSTQNSITVTRSRFGKMDEKDKDLTFEPVSVESVSLNKTSMEMGIGMERDLKVTILPENAADKSVTWSSSDESIAMVSSTGRVTGVAIGSAVITVTTTDGGKTATCNVTVTEATVPIPEAVDLGLSVKWASFNLGASKPEEYGNYYAWGETEPKDDYSWSSYKWCMGDYKTMTKYCSKSEFGYNGFTDSKTVLDLEDDAANANLGSSWRMPTDAEWTELRNNCTWAWTQENGVNGRKVTSNKNGNSIFLPAAGSRNWINLYEVGSSGYYWSSSLDTGYPSTAWSVYFLSGDVYWESKYRFYGFSVRPVSE